MDTILDLRERRAALLANRRLTWLFGADDPGVVVRERWAGEIRLRILVPRGPAPASGRPILLALHGGGWCWGTPEQSRWMTGRIAARVGAVVVAPAYRLAPEHPHPAAVEDCWAVLQWVLANAQGLGADPARVAVLGDSAGGTLAAVLALRARDEGGPRIRGQVLVYPLVDLVGLKGPGVGGIVESYLGGDESLAETWQVSPLRASGHPPRPPLTHRQPCRLILTTNPVESARHDEPTRHRARRRARRRGRPPLGPGHLARPERCPGA